MAQITRQGYGTIAPAVATFGQLGAPWRPAGPDGTIKGIKSKTGDLGVDIASGVEGTDVTTRKIRAGTDITIDETPTGILINSSAASVTTFAALSDVQVTPEAPNQALHYDAVQSKWVQTPEMVVDATTRNLQFISTGSSLFNTVGSNTVASSALTTLAGQTGVSVSSSAGNVNVTSTTGTITASAAGDTTVRSTGANVVLAKPATGFVDISTASETAAAYAGRIGVRPEAVPNVQYVSDAVSSRVAKAGDTMTGNLVMTAPSVVQQSQAPSTGNDLTNKTYVDSLKPLATPQLLGVQPPYPQSLGPQNLSIERRLTRDFTYTPTVDWQQAFNSAMGGNKRAGIKLLSAFTTGTDQNHLVAAYRTGVSNRLVFIEYTTPNNDAVIYRSTTSDTFNDVFTLFGNGLTRVLRFFYVWNDTTNQGEQPLTPEDLQVNARMWDLDISELLTFSTDYLQSYAVSSQVTISGSSGNIIFGGVQTNTNLYGANVFLALVQNEIRHSWTGTGLIYEFGGSTAWNGVNYPLRWRVENINTTTSQIRYTVSSLVGVTFKQLNGSTTPATVTVFTQAQIDNGEIIAEISAPPSTEHSFTVTCDDLTYGTQLVETFRFTSNGSVQRVDGIVQGALTSYARRDGTDTGDVLIGSQGGAATRVELRGTNGTNLFVSAAGGMDLVSTGDESLRLAVQGPSLQNQIVMEVQTDPNSIVLIDKTGLTAADYATHVSSFTKGVPNVQYVNDVVGALTTTDVPEGTNLYYTDVRRDAQTLGDHTGVVLTSTTTGDNLVFISPNWVNRAPVDGQIKANTFDTNLTTGAQLTYTNLTTEVDVVYRIPGETTTALNLSSFPTTSVPLNYGGTFQALGTVGVDGDFYRLGATAADDRWIQNPVPGQISEYRFEGSYSNKTASNSGRIQIRIYNPLSSFSLEGSVPLAQGLTADDFSITLITISDSANLLPTGGGYRIGISSTTSVDVVIQSVVRVDRYHSYRS